MIRLNEDAQIMEQIENLDPSDMVGWTRRFPEALRPAITRDIGIETDQDKNHERSGFVAPNSTPSALVQLVLDAPMTEPATSKLGATTVRLPAA